MKPTLTGRHCAACQETVVDFTDMADDEVVDFLRQYPAIRCGRFRESQLSRPLWATAQPLSGWRRWAGAAVAVLGLGSLAAPHAQGQVTPAIYWGGPVPASSPAQPGGLVPQGLEVPASSAGVAVPASDSIEETATDSILIRGVVHNRLGLPQAGARVKLGGYLSEYVHTDAHGRFQLLVPLTAFNHPRRLWVWWNEEREGGDLYLTAKVAVDATRKRPYHIRLKKPEPIQGGKFR